MRYRYYVLAVALVGLSLAQRSDAQQQAQGMYLVDPTTGTAAPQSVDATHDEPSKLTGPQLQGDCDDTSTDAVNEGDAGKLRVDCTTRAVYTRTVDPCAGKVWTTTAISVTTDTVIIPALASNKNYVCELTIIAGAAEIVSVTEGTGSVCATGEVALAGSTTDANGMSLDATGGVIRIKLVGKTANVDTCLNVSTTSRVAGYVNFVQAP